jgi:VWFA-related protein
MGFSHRVVVALCCLSPLAFTPQCFPQQVADAPAAPPASATPNDLISLDVVVTAKNGKPIAGLRQQDFAVSLDKKPQPIASFQAVEASSTPTLSPDDVEVILLIDTVNTRFINVATERQEIDKYLRQNDGKLPRPMSLLLLTDDGVQIEPTPTSDGNQLSAFLDKAEIGLRTIGRAAGFYGASDRFGISLKSLKQITTYEATRPGRKLIVWVSPGWPLLSGPEVDLTNKDQQHLFANLVDITDSLARARITLSNVDPLGMDDADTYRTIYYKEFLKGIAKPSDIQIGNLALQVLATQTGGRVLNSNNDVAQEISTAVSDAEAFYVLKLQPTAAEHPNQYRSLAVTLVDKPGLTARTRNGYYAQPTLATAH